jgi:hypothetical protein
MPDLALPLWAGRSLSMQAFLVGRTTGFADSLNQLAERYSALGLLVVASRQHPVAHLLVVGCARRDRSQPIVRQPIGPAPLVCLAPSIPCGARQVDHIGDLARQAGGQPLHVHDIGTIAKQ